METLLTKMIPKSQTSPLNKLSFSPRQNSTYISPILNLTQLKTKLKTPKTKLSSTTVKYSKSRSLFYKEIAEICKKLDPKFELDEDGTNCYGLIKETVNRAVDLVITQAGKLAKQAKEMEQDKEYIQKIQGNLTEIEKQVLEREKALKSKEDMLNEQIKTKVHQPETKEIEQVLLDLQAQIEDFNKDISEKEKFLQSWASDLESKEKSLQDKQTELKSLEWNLKKSELELNLLTKESVGKLSNPSENSEKLYRELFMKNQELNRKIRENNEEFRILQSVKKQIEEVLEKNVSERQVALKKRISELDEREKEIAGFELNQGMERLKKVNAAEEFKQERFAYEEEKGLKIRELGLLRDVEQCVNKLDNLVLLLLRKETELKQ